MNITKDNYRNLLDSLNSKIGEIPPSGVGELQKAIDRLKTEVSAYRLNADALLESNNILRIGIVGQVKAGKSSFLNSMLFGGENILPRAATPMTAGLTVLEYSEDNHFEVEYYSEAEWQTFEDRADEVKRMYNDWKAQDPVITMESVLKEMGPEYQSAYELCSSCTAKARNCIAKESKKERHNFSDVEEMQDVLNQYVGADGAYTSVVKCLTIRLNLKELKDIQIVDTPGVNDPVVSREERTREFLNQCHGVFFLSYTGRFFDSTDVDFLVKRIGGNGIGSIVVIASKFDSVLQDAGIKYEDDLAGSMEYCFKSLKRQMTQNISSSEYKGSVPLFDFSSGIGYSIYKKPEERWDATEKHVVAQMKRFYPSFFSNIKDIKSTFYDLSQIEEIDEKYLNGIFVRNKESIIASKMNAYFQEMSKSLYSQVDMCSKEIEKLLKNLENGKKSDIINQKKEIEKVIRTLKGKIGRYSDDIEHLVKNGVRDILNELSFAGLILSTSKENKLFKRTSTSFLSREKTVSAYVEVVDKNKTSEDSKKYLECEFKNIAGKWKDIIEKSSKVLKDKMNEVITKSEQDDNKSILDFDILRDILDDTLSKFNEYSTFEYLGYKESAYNSVLQKLQIIKDIPYDCAGKCSEAEASDRIQQKSRSIVEAARVEMEKVRKGVLNEVSSTLKKLSKTLNEEIAETLNNMVEEVNNRANEYVDQLKKELEHVEENHKRYLNVRSKINEIKQDL